MPGPRILVVQHEAMCPPGWVGEWLVEAGAGLDVRKPYAGDGLPATLDDHDAMVVLGGSMGADDDADHAWLTDVKELVRVAAGRGVPTWGICLGHQLCAVALGGEVVRNPRGQQIGVLDVGWHPDAVEDPLFARVPRPTRAAQWNNDIVVTLPRGAQPLARTGHAELQAARFAPTVWGVQWHPEAGGDIVRVWADNDRDEAIERGVDVDEYVGHVTAAEPELRATWQPLADGFVAHARTRAPAAP
jgi:GMP synthase (glutamine-hydrolysing)